jgi:O-antigen/teichoic acid export membrane protein
VKTTGLHRSFALLATANAVAPLCSVSLVLAIARLGGVEMLGKYSLLTTVFILGQNCAPLGLPIVLTREVAAAPRDAGRWMAAACAVSLACVGVVVLASAPLIGATVADAPLAQGLVLILLALVPSVVTLHGEAVLLALGRAADVVAIAVAENAVRAAAGVALVATGCGLAAVAGAFLATRALAAVATIGVLRRRGVTCAVRPPKALCRTLARHVPVVGAIPLVNAVYARADVFVVTWLGSWTDVGLYGAATRIVDLARTVSPAYGKALYPLLARLHATRSREFAVLGAQAVREVVVVAATLAFGIAALSGWMIDALYGPALAPAADVLAVLAWTLIPAGLATVLAQLLFAADRQIVDLRVNAVATVASVALNVVLVPRLGARGAAVSALAAATLYAVLQYAGVCRDVETPRALGWLARLLVVTAGAMAVLRIGGSQHPVFAAAVGLAAFAAGLAAARLVTRDDIARVWPANRGIAA